MSSKYVDPVAITQVIGCVFNSPKLLDLTDKYTVTEEDFVENFHKILFGAIYKIHESGVTNISIENITDYLSTKPKSFAIYNQNKGEEYLNKIVELSSPMAFDYYYSRMKKMSLLRAYDNYGIDVSFIYDIDNILDTKKKQEQEEFLDNSSLIDIADLIDQRIQQVRFSYADNEINEAVRAGDGVLELIETLKKNPEVGIPLYGPIINTVTRGARLRKFYLRSAPTGCGKTRSLIADACFIGCDKMYDPDYGWISIGEAQPALFITTEQDKEELQTMMLAFLSNVDEEHIINGYYTEGEEERVIEAGKILLNSSLYIEELPDFSLQDVENTILRNIREHDIMYVMYDYIHTSMKILEEITKRSGGVKLREDNILFMLSTRLKDICNKYGIFIFSATQLNGSFKDEKIPDQTLLRGAKAIADKIDFGCILLNTTDEDIESLESILSTGIFERPNIKLSVYKNRRGKYKGVYLWCKADLGTCRIRPMFCTSYGYELIPIDNVNIEVKSAF